MGPLPRPCRALRDDGAAPESGRITALWSIAFLGPRPVASFVDGALADAFGVRVAGVAGAARAGRSMGGVFDKARYSRGVIMFGLALALAIPSPVPAARAASHTQGPLVLRAAIDDRSSVVAFGGSRPAAVVMEYAGKRWHAIPQGSVRVKPLNPRPGSVRSPGTVRLAARFAAGSRILAAGMWLDNRAVPAGPKGTFTSFTARGLPRQVSAGRHYVVAFAGVPGSAYARIWSFRVR